MTSIEKQFDMPAVRPAAISNRSSLSFVLVVALAIILIACGLGRLTFQSGASGWSPESAAEATSLVGQ